MSDYPDIEREVPAWKEICPLLPIPGSRFSHEWLTGLAQFVRAVVREMDREEQPEEDRHTTAVQNATPPDLAERQRQVAEAAVNRVSFYKPRHCGDHPRPDLSDRLAREAEETMRDLDGLSADEGWAAYILRPYFQRLERYISNKIVEIETIDQAIRELLSEVNCRREHGASGGEHLEYIEGRLEKILRAVRGKG